MKVLFLTNLPSPYMVNFFNELGKKCELTVIFERSYSSERNGRWNDFKFDNFCGIILKGIPMSPDSALSIGVFRYLTNSYDHIIVSNPMTPTGIIAIEYMRMKRIRYIIESEGSFPKDGRGVKEWFKKHIISKASAYFSTTARADEYFLAYGAPKDRIYHYPFTSLYKKDVLEAPLSKQQRTDIRKKICVCGERIAVAVGRLIPLKRYDELIEAWKNMPSDWHLYVLGEGEELPRLSKIAEEFGLGNIHFPGYKEKDELVLYYKAADVFVHPTSTDVWGLVINEAMACGLPIITTEMCIAGDALVENGKNGYIIPVGDVCILANCIYKVMKDEKNLEKMSMESITRIQEYTFESMADIHIKLLSNLEKQSE